MDRRKPPNGWGKYHHNDEKNKRPKPKAKFTRLTLKEAEKELRNLIETAIYNLDNKDFDFSGFAQKVKILMDNYPDLYVNNLSYTQMSFSELDYEYYEIKVKLDEVTFTLQFGGTWYFFVQLSFADGNWRSYTGATKKDTAIQFSANIGDFSVVDEKVLALLKLLGFAE